MGLAGALKAAPPQRDGATVTSPDINEITVAAAFETVRQRIEQAIADAGMTLFARIDHEAGARAAGLEMPPTQVLIYGNARAGTPIMLTAPLAALDLPLHLLIRQLSATETSIAYRSAGATLAPLGVLPSLIEKLEQAQKRVAMAAG